MHDYGPPPGAPPQAPAAGAPARAGARRRASSAAASRRPRRSRRGRRPTAAAAAPPPPATGGAAAAPRAVVHVRTDVLDLDISTRGGTLDARGPARLSEGEGRERRRCAWRTRTPDDALRAAVRAHRPGRAAPYPNAPRDLQQRALADYTLEGAAELRVPLTWSEGGRHGHQDLHLPARRVRASASTTRCTTAARALGGAPYAQILRNDPRTKSSYFNVESYAFHGPAIHDGTKYRKLDTTEHR